MKTFLLVLLLCPLLVRAEFRAAIAVRVVTPEPLLPVSGGLTSAEAERGSGLPVCGVLKTAKQIAAVAGRLVRD